MSRPNSLLTRFRSRLATWIEPWPPMHEAWCQDCDLNNGRTLVIGTSAIRDHAHRHAEAGTRKPMRIKAKSPASEVL